MKEYIEFSNEEVKLGNGSIIGIDIIDKGDYLASNYLEESIIIDKPKLRDVM